MPEDGAKQDAQPAGSILTQETPPANTEAKPETKAQTPAASTTATTDWRTGIPQDIAADPTLKDIKDVAALAKGYVSAQKMIGGRIPIPKPDDKDGWNEVYAKLGRPVEASVGEKGYEVPKENMPEAIKLDDGALAEYAKLAHSLGLNKQQYAAHVRFQAEMAAKGMEAITKAQQTSQAEAVGSLQKEWGPAFEQNVSLARSGVDAAAKLAGADAKEVKQHLEKLGVANDPVLIKMFSAFGKEMASDEVRGGGRRQPFILSPTEARNEIARMNSDAEANAALTKKNHPKHAEVMNRWKELHEIAAGTEV